MRNLIVLVITCVVSACVRPDYVDTLPDRYPLTARPQPGYAIKQVIDKQGPITLIAHDGSHCRTSRERFAVTQAGGWIACVWLLPSLDSTQLAGRLSMSGGPHHADLPGPMLSKPFRAHEVTDLARLILTGRVPSMTADEVFGFPIRPGRESEAKASP